VALDVGGQRGQRAHMVLRQGSGAVGQRGKIRQRGSEAGRGSGAVTVHSPAPPRTVPPPLLDTHTPHLQVRLQHNCEPGPQAPQLTTVCGTVFSTGIMPHLPSNELNWRSPPLTCRCGSSTMSLKSRLTCSAVFSTGADPRPTSGLRLVSRTSLGVPNQRSKALAADRVPSLAAQGVGEKGG